VYWKNRAEALINQGTSLWKKILDSGKVEGISASVADEIFQDSDAPYLIVRQTVQRSPFKAPAEHGPSFSSVTMVVAMMGLAVSALFTEATTFRVDGSNILRGSKPEVFSSQARWQGFLHRQGSSRTPEGASKLFF
jgi:hypothetical protein